MLNLVLDRKHSSSTSNNNNNNSLIKFIIGTTANASHTVKNLRSKRFFVARMPLSLPTRFCTTAAHVCRPVLTQPINNKSEALQGQKTPGVPGKHF